MNLFRILSCATLLCLVLSAQGEAARAPSQTPEKIQSVEQIEAELMGRFYLLQEVELRFHAADKAYHTKINGISLISRDDFRNRKAQMEKAQRAVQSAAATYLVVEGYQRITTILRRR